MATCAQKCMKSYMIKHRKMNWIFIFHMQKKMKNGFDLVLKTKNYFDVQQQIQFSPGIYELYDRDKLLKSEHMDFQTHLYKFGEMENYLREAGFTEIKTYSSFEKEIAIDDCCDMFLFECNL